MVLTHIIVDKSYIMQINVGMIRNQSIFFTIIIQLPYSLLPARIEISNVLVTSFEKHCMVYLSGIIYDLIFFSSTTCSPISDKTSRFKTPFSSISPTSYFPPYSSPSPISFSTSSISCSTLSGR